MSKNSHAVIYFIIFILSFMFLFSCFGGIPTMRTVEIQNKGILLVDLLPGKFGNLWVERTIQLKATFDRLKSSTGMMGGPGGGGFYPLIAQATFIDSTLIECGLNEFENLSEMSDEEKRHYEKIYKETYKTANSHFIWLELQTPYTKEVLDLNRWTIYLEDNKGNKYDPQEIIEYSIEADKDPIQNSIPPSIDSIDNKYWKNSSKTVLLYFPKINIYGGKIIDGNSKTISLVIFNWRSKNVNNIGTWDLKFLYQKGNT